MSALDRPERPPAQGSRLWLFYLIFALALSVLYFLFPAHHLELWTPLGLSAVVATVVGIWRYQPRQRAAWYLLAGAELSFISGDTTYNVLTGVLHQDNPFPSLADVFYLLTYLLIAAGIFLFIRGRSSIRDRASLIDAVIITTGLGLLSWVYLVVPDFEADGLTGIQQLISVGYPLGDVLILAMLARLVVGGGLRFRSMQFLIIGAAGVMIADVLYGLIQLNGSWQVGGPVDSGWVIFYLAWGCAALHPSMGRLSEILPRRNVRMGRSRVALLAAVSLIAPGVLLAESVTGQPIQARPVALFSAALFLLVTARLWGILQVHQHSIDRERTLRASSEALVAAQGLSSIYHVAVDAALALTGSTAGARAAIYLAVGEGVTCAASAGAGQDAQRHQELWLSAAAGGRLNSAGTLSVTPLGDELDERGMLVVDSPAPLTLDQHDALSTLAAQVALAVESAKLAEDLRQRRNAERFRGIIQNTSDIIVVVNAQGQITYGTPSLTRNLGRSSEELLGREFAEFLHEDDAAAAIAVFADFTAASTHAPAITDWRLRHRDGQLVAFEVLSTNMLEDTSVGGIVLTMRDVSERRALEAQLIHQAFHDPLTGLPNRALFQDRAEHALARTARLGTLVAMLMIDLDDFKIVNDSRGHASGDELLSEVAARLRSTLRKGATVSRFGGDEFAILVEDLTDVSQAERFAERALEAFAAPFMVGGEELTVRVSIGLVVTSATHGLLDMTELMRCADLALYAAKERGKGQFMLYDPELSTRMLDRHARRADLARAIDANEFVLHYQPIISIDTGEIVSCEALVRWNHPSRGLVFPLEFVELAEETGRIVDLGRWVLDQACAQIRSWADLGHTGLTVSVNVSARELHEPSFVDGVRSALRRHHVSADHMVLELTESIFALDAPATAAKLRTLRDELGIKISMDDFGTGYSSLSYLQRFQLDTLKIDKSFVDRLGEGDLDGIALVRAIITLAHSLRLNVVAEGIERVAQRDELWAMGCSRGQGYLYSRPVDAEQMSAFLSSASALGPQAPAGGPDVARLPVPA